MGLHECQNAFDAGSLPARCNVDQHHGAERRRPRFTRHGQTEQPAHRRTDQDRRLRLRACDVEQIVDEMLHVVVAARHVIAFAVATAIEGHTAATLRGHRLGSGLPRAARLTKAVCE